MILRELESVGTIIRTIPTAKELEDEQFDLEFIIGLCSKEPIEKIVKLVKGNRCPRSEKRECEGGRDSNRTRK